MRQTTFNAIVPCSLEQNKHDPACVRSLSVNDSKLVQNVRECHSVEPPEMSYRLVLRGGACGKFAASTRLNEKSRSAAGLDAIAAASGASERTLVMRPPRKL